MTATPAHRKTQDGTPWDQSQYPSLDDLYRSDHLQCVLSGSANHTKPLPHDAVAPTERCGAGILHHRPRNREQVFNKIIGVVHLSAPSRKSATQSRRSFQEP